MNEPVPAGRNQSVFADELQYWSPVPATSVGAAFETVGAVSGVTVKLAVPVLVSLSVTVTDLDPLSVALDVQV